jgi:signal recognition particle subunit SRP54
MFGILASGLRTVFRRLAARGCLDDAALGEALRDMRVVLLEADVSLPVAKSFLSRVREKASGMRLARGVSPADQVARIVYEELVALLGSQDATPFPRCAPTVVMLVGLHGCGKTTTCVKLCKLVRTAGRDPLLLAADTRRAAAPEQLVQLAETVGVDVVVRPGLDPPDIAALGRELLAGHARRVVVVDTGGRLHVDEDLMGELQRMESLLEPSDTFLVADAMTGQDAVRIAREFGDRLRLTGVILTKMDGDARGGAALSMREATGTPVRFIGVGERPDDLEPFQARRVAGRILGFGDLATLAEKATVRVDPAEAARVQQAVRRGTFDLNDLLSQLRHMRKLGPAENLLALLPGADRVSGSAGARELARAEAIICSMTPMERRRPDMIDGSRRRRIARGSGTTVQEVNELLKQLQLFRNVAKKAGRKGLASLLGRLA